VELDTKLLAILSGKEEPTDVRQRLAFAQLCGRYKRLYLAAARFYQRVFTDEPAFADDAANGHRYNAACAAALAGTGPGKDAAMLSEPERVRWRQQALTWLRADLGRLDKDVQSGQGGPRQAAAKVLQHWLRDPDFTQVRDAAALARLPEAEQQAWRDLWA